MITFLSKLINNLICSFKLQFNIIANSRLINNLIYINKVLKIVSSKLSVTLQVLILVFLVFSLFVFSIYVYVILGSLIGIVPFIYCSDIASPSAIEQIEPTPLHQRITNPDVLVPAAELGVTKQLDAYNLSGLNLEGADASQFEKQVITSPFSSSLPAYKRLAADCYLEDHSTFGGDKKLLKTHETLAGNHFRHMTISKMGWFKKGVSWTASHFLFGTDKTEATDLVIATATNQLADQFGVGAYDNFTKLVGLPVDAQDNALLEGVNERASFYLQKEPDTLRRYDRNKLLHHQTEDIQRRFWSNYWMHGQYHGLSKSIKGMDQVGQTYFVTMKIQGGERLAKLEADRDFRKNTNFPKTIWDKTFNRTKAQSYAMKAKTNAKK